MIKIMIGILIFTGLLFFLSNEKLTNFTQLCESKGGKVLLARDLRACVDPKIFISVE